MILSRVLIAIASVLVAIAILTILLVDSRSNTEKSLEYINSGKYFKVLNLYASNSEKNEEDIALLSQALSEIELKNNLSQNESFNKDWLEHLNGFPEIKHIEFSLNGTYCTHIEDPYLKILKKHTYWYQKSLLKKINSTIPCNTSEKNSEYLNRLLLEDPRNFIKESETVLQELFRSPLEPVGEIESQFLKETIHFLATQENSLFHENLFYLAGDRVNFRSGPGVEYPSKMQLAKDEELLCFDKENRSETIGGKLGNWLECFSDKHFKSGWVFSGQLKKKSPELKVVESFKSRFSNNQAKIQISFDTWKDSTIPNYFYGEYLPTERYLRKGEVGFTIYKPEDGKIVDICRKFVGENNSFEIFFNSQDSNQLTQILSINLKKSNISKPIFKILANSKNIQINDKKIEIAEMLMKDSIKIKVTARQDNKLIGNVFRKNSLILTNISSYPIDSQYWKDGKSSWEICIPQARKRSKDKSYLYGLEIVNES